MADDLAGGLESDKDNGIRDTEENVMTGESSACMAFPIPSSIFITDEKYLLSYSQ